MTVRAEPNPVMVRVRGEVDVHSVAALRSALLAAVTINAPLVVVDLAEACFAGAVLLDVLVQTRDKIGNTGSRIVVTEANSLTYTMFAITGLTQMFDVRRRESAPRR